MDQLKMVTAALKIRHLTDLNTYLINRDGLVIFTDHSRDTEHSNYGGCIQSFKRQYHPPKPSQKGLNIHFNGFLR